MWDRPAVRGSCWGSWGPLQLCFREHSMRWQGVCRGMRTVAAGGIEVLC